MIHCPVLRRALSETYRLSLALIFCLSAFCLVFAQDTVTGAFAGTVTESQTETPIKDAAVEIINEQTKLVIKLTTDNRGHFYQGLLNPGIYTIRGCPVFQFGATAGSLRLAAYS